MKVFLVTTTGQALAGIEKCTLFIVYPAQEAAFFRQYAGSIIMAGQELLTTIPIVAIEYRTG